MQRFCALLALAMPGRASAGDTFSYDQLNLAGDTEYRVQVGLRFQWEYRDGSPSRQ
jgi:hypothetical protein